MIQELSEKIWENPDFQEAFAAIERVWLSTELKLTRHEDASEALAVKTVNAATILACSQKPEQRLAAFKIATCAYELFEKSDFPFDLALRVVLTRLGNFPAILTKTDVRDSQEYLPWLLASEELFFSDQRTVIINGKSFELTDFQFNLWADLSKKLSVALSAPTSAGKSFILESYLSSVTIAKDICVLYIVPTRALISQVASDFTKVFENLAGSSPDILTVPPDKEKKLPPRAIFVMTQERTQLAIMSHADFAPDIIVVDEAQSIADGARGVLLQFVIDDLIARKPDAQILFASPTIRNLEVFKKLFGLHDLVQRVSKEPTVSQNFIAVDIRSSTKGLVRIRTAQPESGQDVFLGDVTIGQTLASRTDKLVQVPAFLGQGQANLIYANTADEAERIAIQMADKLYERETTQAREDLASLAEEAVHNSYVLAQCVRKGIGFHYGNIPTVLRLAIEKSFKNGDLDYLVCTSTLLQGVNMPAKNIFIYKPKKGIKTKMESPDFWNLSGRAGRLLREFQGNIFLIDYEKWDSLLLDGPRDIEVIPAMQNIITKDTAELTNLILDLSATDRKKAEQGVETTFVRLLSDLKAGTLSQTLERIGISEFLSLGQELTNALESAAKTIHLPGNVIKQTPSVSAHKQQQLYNFLIEKIAEKDQDPARLLPAHPRDSNAFNSYAAILEICHAIILEHDIEKKLHRFHAVMACKWMRGEPLPQIIAEQLARNPDKHPRTVIRNALDVIENKIRFQTLRLLGCYCSLLSHALIEANQKEVAESMPAVQLFLEVGASDRTMISLIELGLSRTVALKLNEASADKNLDVDAARAWLLNRPLQSFNLSHLLEEDVEEVIKKLRKQ